MDTINTEKFYGSKVRKHKFKSNVSWVKTYRVMPSHILGPTQYWQEFYRQVDALTAAAKFSTNNKTETLCIFAYQRPSDGSRRFVVAHPEVYWWHYKAKPEKERCSYEVKALFKDRKIYTLYLYNYKKLNYNHALNYHGQNIFFRNYNFKWYIFNLVFSLSCYI